MIPHRLTSARFPYLPITVSVRGHSIAVEAMLDTGFDGDLAVPESVVRNWGTTDTTTEWTLADAREVDIPTYFVDVQVGDFGPFPAVLVTLGKDVLIGRRLMYLFTVILDHGLRVIVEP